MADIEVVIKIPEELLSEMDDENYQSVISWYDTTLYCAIEDGTLLPKGHGELKDESDLDLTAPSLGTDGYINDLMAKHNIDYANGDDEDKVRAFASDLIHSCMNVIRTAPTIIGADKESEDKVCE